MKYVIPEWLVGRIVDYLLGHMAWDPHAQEDGYPVTSLYFDNVGLRCYHEKMAGLWGRKKLRLRTYSENFCSEQPIFAEIKQRNDAVVLKDRFLIPYIECTRAIEANRFDGLSDSLSIQGREVLSKFLWAHKYNCLMPKLLVSYHRRPLLGRADPRLRVTFDTCLVCHPYRLLGQFGRAKQVAPYQAVMEIKYNNTVPYWLHDVIQQCNLERISFSKYCRSVEAAVKHYGHI